MLIECIEDFRLFLLSKGFTQAGTTGNNYYLTNEDCSMTFDVDIKSKTMIATIPDFQYNMIYPQARRNSTFTLNLKDFRTVQTDINNFMTRIEEIYNKKGI